MARSAHAHAIAGTALVTLATLALTVVALVATFPEAIGQSTSGVCADIQYGVDHRANKVSLIWPAVGTATSYQVYRQIEGSPYVRLATLSGEATGYSDRNVPNGILNYRVAANGAPTDECPTANVHVGGRDQTVEGPTPACVGGLEAGARGNGDVQLSWAPTPGARQYDILRGDGDGPLAPFATTPGGTTTFVDASTSPGTTYRYAVVANGPPTNGPSCTPVEITAVPFLGAALVGGVSLLAVLGAVVVMRRRRK